MPIGLGTAAIVGGGLAATGAVIGASMNSSAINKSTQASTAAANQSIEEQKREFDKTQANEAPFLTTGTSALDTLAKMYGLSQAAPGATDASGAGPATPGGSTDYSSFYESPDYKFQLDRGLKGVQASAAANGSLDSGATRKAEISFAGNLANSNFNQYANRLQALAGGAQTSAGVDATTGTNTANAVSNILQNNGNNNANAALARGSSYGTAINQLAGIGSGAFQNYAASQQYAPLTAAQDMPVTVTPPIQIPGYTPGVSAGGY